MNVLLITVDDLNWDSLACSGGPVADASPNIDRLASEGLRFERAHVTAAVCMPSRAALATGRYPHRSGIEGFRHTLKAGTPTIMGLLQDAGFRCGILGKVGHSTPDQKFRWDLNLDMGDLGQGRDPARYAAAVKGFLAESGDRPFYLMVNSHDPHRPFCGSAQEAKQWPNERIAAPSRTYTPEDVRTPGFLPDLPEVRREMAEYFGSVRRCDDTVGAVLAELDAAGRRDDTLVMFLSDNGMAVPFAKTNCYLHSTKTPWIVRWPGVVKAGGVDRDHAISGIDFLPTVFEALGLPLPAGIDGRSFLPLLHGKPQDGRDLVFTQFHETSGRNRYPMRAVEDAHHRYIFSPWSDGERVFRNESQSGRTFAAMTAAAGKDPAIAARVDFFLHRTVEELYDLKQDQDSLHNLIAETALAPVRERLRGELLRWMEAVDDPALPALRDGDLAGFMAAEDLAAGQGKAKATNAAD